VLAFEKLASRKFEKPHIPFPQLQSMDILCTLKKERSLTNFLEIMKRIRDSGLRSRISVQNLTIILSRHILCSKI